MPTDDRLMTVTDRVRSQHETILELFDQVEEGTSESLRAWKSLIRLLAVHETAEEIVLYPAVWSTGRAGMAAVRARQGEERRAKISLANLEGMEIGSTKFDTAFVEFRAAVEAHAAAEETEILPVLDQRHGSNHLRTMDRFFVAAQLVAPTHAHRFAPVGAVGNLAIGPLVGLVDRVRDLVAS